MPVHFVLSVQDDERYCFIVEWYEEMAARTRQFQFFYFVNSKAIEMVSMSVVYDLYELHDLSFIPWERAYCAVSEKM